MSFLIALSLVLVAQDSKDDLVVAEMARHSGNWAVDSFEYDGAPAKPEVVKSITREVRGDKVTWKRDGKPFSSSTLSVDIKGDPKHLTVVPEGGQARAKPVKGIYKFEGNTLTLCMAEPGEDAPQTFKAPKETRYTLIVLHRAPATARPRRR